MSDLGRILLFAGIGIAIFGALVMLAGRMGFRGIPGDVAYEGRNVRFYFPIVTCIVLSLVMTLGMWLWNWMSRR